MKRRKLLVFSILVCLMFSLGFILSKHNEIYHSKPVNVVTESKEKESQELEILPIEIEDNQDIDKHDKMKTEKETDKDMKKEFKKPTVEIVEFDNEDVITTSDPNNPEAPVVPPEIK